MTFINLNDTETRAKYYTPELSEFYVGFEYYKLDSTHKLTIMDFSGETPAYDLPGGYEEWWKHTFSGEELRSVHVPFKELIDDGNIKVKKLDKEDIENLGFTDYKHGPCDWYKLEQEVKDNVSSYGYWRCFRLRHNYDTNAVCITAHESGFDDGEEFTLFQGVIKNKSELIKLLKQLNIITC